MSNAAINWIVTWGTYSAQAFFALWGAFCVILVLRRVAQIRFRSEEEQDEFLDDLDASLAEGDFQKAADTCDVDQRVMPQLALLALTNRHLGYSKIRSLLPDHFQRDVLSDLEYRLSWVNTVIKSEPMLGLFGTVTGMMAAFGKLATGDKVDPTQLASDISFALITTAIGLAVAIPLILATATINVRIRKMEDLVASGLTRFLESLKEAMTNYPLED
jgi:biopolymer transport protein ExbB/TolQ